MTPRERIAADIHRTKGTFGCMGLLMVFIGIPFAVLIGLDSSLPEDLGVFVLGQALFMVLWLPGLFMVRSWLRRTDNHPLMVAVDNPSTICLLDMDWVSINGGPPNGRVRIGTTAGRDDYVTIDAASARAVFAWLQTIAPHATIGATAEHLATLRSNPEALIRAPGPRADVDPTLVVSQPNF